MRFEINALAARLTERRKERITSIDSVEGFS
jgi:hypothetical protein